MKISVCMATYNGEQYIKEQVTSILNQLRKDDELIVSDDHSADNTIKILESFEDPRIFIFINPREKGYTRNFENAISKANGDIIFLSDQDDIWIEGKVKKMLRKFDDADLVISNAEIVDSKLHQIHPSHFELYHVKSGFWINLLKTRYIGACMAFKRELLVKALPFPKNQEYCAHDYWITAIGEAYYKVSLEETPLLKYRRHGENASLGGGTSTRPIFKRIAIRIYTLINLFSRLGRKS